MITKGLILAASVFACSAAGAVHDPVVELFPGRKMPLSQVGRTVAVWDSAVAGRGPAWINSDLKLQTYMNPIFARSRTGHHRLQGNCPPSINALKDVVAEITTRLQG